MSADILIIEDQEGIRMLLLEICTNAGYHVCTASTGKEAVDILNEKTFQLLILDYNLPMISGAEVLRRLDHSRVKSAVILISGMTEAIDDELIRHPLVKHVVSKPFDIQYMLRLVQSILPT
ncbi:MAG TPA: response regulator [Bacillota bacterium]|nr:response regulator [Bacillota bacterium]